MTDDALPDPRLSLDRDELPLVEYDVMTVVCPVCRRRTMHDVTELASAWRYHCRTCGTWHDSAPPRNGWGPVR